jgi:ABC-type Fe3+ transport system substrate-binding protein
MVPKGNPAKVTGLASLGGASIKLAMPNPEFEGIARQISSALEAAGGKPLADKVYKAKVADGTSILTHIHHRQTPLWIMQGKAQAGVTWQSEVAFQMQAGHPIEGVEIPPHRIRLPSMRAPWPAAPHPEAAKRWLEFIRSPEALAIFGRYGFKPYQASPQGLFARQRFLGHKRNMGYATRFNRAIGSLSGWNSPAGSRLACSQR